MFSNLCSVGMTSWLNVRSNCIVLADNGQMTGSLYKGASSEAQGDQHAVKTALIFYYSIWPTIATYIGRTTKTDP